jgi:hypothetical protein
MSLRSERFKSPWFATAVIGVLTSLLLWVTLITIGIGLVYWLVVILPQRGRAWTLRHAVIDDTAGEDG